MTPIDSEKDFWRLVIALFLSWLIVYGIPRLMLEVIRP